MLADYIIGAGAMQPVLARRDRDTMVTILKSPASLTMEHR